MSAAAPPVTAWLAACLPDAAIRLAQAWSAPCFQFDIDTAQAGLDLGRLEHIVAGLPLAAAPGASPHALRRRQLAYLGGRLCAERALAAAGLAQPCGVGRGGAGQPLWPRGWSGSISHNATRAFAVAAARQGRHDLGIDVEQLVDARTRRAIEQVCMGQDEVALVAAAPDPGLAATALFAAKEAYYKAIHVAVGRFVDFREMVVTGLDAGAGTAGIVLALAPAPACALPPARVRIVVCGGMVLAATAPGYMAREGAGHDCTGLAT